MFRNTVEGAWRQGGRGRCLEGEQSHIETVNKSSVLGPLPPARSTTGGKSHVAQQSYGHRHLGQDPEIRYTPMGMPMVNFSIVTDKYIDKDGERQERSEWR